MDAIAVCGWESTRALLLVRKMPYLGLLSVKAGIGNYCRCLELVSYVPPFWIFYIAVCEPAKAGVFAGWPNVNLVSLRKFGGSGGVQHKKVLEVFVSNPISLEKS